MGDLLTFPPPSTESLRCAVCLRPCKESYDLRDPETLAVRRVGECHAVAQAVELLNKQWERAAHAAACGSYGRGDLEASDALLVLSIFSARFAHDVYARRR